ncbi:hypothetical protein JNB71_01675 [Rhizobium herbae]|uniref:Uncharacterized protein n=1 Tax=Rhizobium herbae TaxID=508661 RepID=A0ABS7H4J5_9HYPH|nr:hypothetical protein [Rhizobium herbae]MBW9062014.1 hypothetical protein [Rhizobium herbae]
MPHPKPFYRTFRGMKPSPNSGYSQRAYVRDKEYASSPLHYIRAFNIIQSDLQRIFEYVEPSDESKGSYSYRIHELLMRTCIEVEANLKAILNANTYTPEIKYGKPFFNIKVYQKVDVTHHLSSYQVLLPIWHGPKKFWKPFEGWKQEAKGLPWYQAYNSSKHDRQEAFKSANLEMLISAVAGLLVVLSSQFITEDFSSGADLISAGGDDYHDLEPALGGLFRIKFPDDWAEDELYEFNWSVLKNEQDRFQKFDYDAN